MCVINQEHINKINIKEKFNCLAAEFKLLYNVRKILYKLNHQLESLVVIEKNLFLYLQSFKETLSTKIFDQKALEINILLVLIEKYLSAYKMSIIKNNKLLSVDLLRYYIKNNQLKEVEVVTLLQFEFYLHSIDISSHAKVEVLLAKLTYNVKQLDNIQNIITLFDKKPNYKNIYYADMIDKIISINKQIKSVNDFESLIKSNVIKQVRNIKNSLRDNFWYPEVLAYLIFTNINLSEHFAGLLEKECNFIKHSVEHLILKEVEQLAKLHDIGRLDLFKIYELVSEVNLWINQEYNNNYKNLTKIAYAGELIRQMVGSNLDTSKKEILIDITSINDVININSGQSEQSEQNEQNKQNVNNKVIAQTNVNGTEKGWAVVSSVESDSVEYWEVKSNKVIDKLNNTVGDIIETNDIILNINNVSNKIKKVKSPYIINKKTCKFNRNNEFVLLEEKWAEEQLEYSIDNIISILEKRSLNAPRQLIKLRYSELVLTSDEVNILIGNMEQSKYKLLKRAMALSIQLQESLAFYEDRVNLLAMSRGVYGLHNILYYLSQAKITINNINNYISEYSKEDDKNKSFELALFKTNLEERIRQINILFNKAKIDIFCKTIAA